MGRSQRTKGQVGERELAGILSDELGRVVKRKLGQERDGGDDIQVGKFRIDAKRCEAVRADQWAKEIEAQCQADEIPVTAYRRNGEPWRVILRLSDFVPLMRGELGEGDANDGNG